MNCVLCYGEKEVSVTKQYAFIILGKTDCHRREKRNFCLYGITLYCTKEYMKKQRKKCIMNNNARHADSVFIILSIYHFAKQKKICLMGTGT